ncbi:MAG TPA: HAMP domain-containing sensor histidine kinase, partial [Bacilli bacterium]|nr:HAMP domain-containing sensor histidine kinase [Bacilli bacterium]
RIEIFMSSLVIIIAYIRKCPLEGLLLSIFYAFLISLKYDINIIVLLSEGLVYYLIYKFINKYKYNNNYFIIIYLMIKMLSLVFLIRLTFTDNILITLILCLILTVIIIFMINKGDNIIKYHIAYKDLLQEKQIKTSLFKITHEIKNPLAVCKGYFDMLDMNNSKQVQKYIPIIKDEVIHALMILNDFSDLSKIKINKDLVDVNYILEETINNIRELAKINNINIKYKNNEEIYIEGDYTRLMQVFINVIKNSIEALDNRLVKKISININNDEKEVTIIFDDNGCGMDEEVKNSFDKPFYTTKVNGTGLGTTLSKEIIMAHDGTIKYESEFNKGTRVIITLPKIATS